MDHEGVSRRRFGPLTCRLTGSGAFRTTPAGSRALQASTPTSAVGTLRAKTVAMIDCEHPQVRQTATVSYPWGLRAAPRKANAAASWSGSRSPSRRPLRSKRVTVSGRFDQFARSGLSKGSTAAALWPPRSVRRKASAVRTAAAPPGAPWVAGGDGRGTIPESPASAAPVTPAASSASNAAVRRLLRVGDASRVHTSVGSSQIAVVAGRA